MKFLVSKSGLLAETAKWAVTQSPYAFPEGLEGVLTDFNAALGTVFDDLKLGLWEGERQEMGEILERRLLSIPQVQAWNEPKKGSTYYRFVSAYDGPSDPDYDFIDLGALARNILNGLEKEHCDVQGIPWPPHHQRAKVAA